MSEAQDPRKVLIRQARLSYPSLLEPRRDKEDPDKKPMYQASFILNPSEKMAPFKAAILAAAQEKFGSDYKEVVKHKKFHMPLLEQADYDKAGYGDEGYFIRTKSPRKPGVVHNDAARTPVLDSEEIFGGLIVAATVRAYGWENDKGGKGVSFSVENVMLLKDDGTRYDSRTSPDEDFAGIQYDEDNGEAAELPDDSDDIFGDM